MKTVTIISVLALVILVGCGSSRKMGGLPASKEATCIENIEGKEDRYLAWGIGEDNEEAETDALKCALWSTMCGGGVGNCVSLMQTGERVKHERFIADFFSDSGEWSQYVRSSNQGRIDKDKRLKLSDGRVKLGVDVIVSRKNLREYLEARGVIGGMRIGG